MGLKLAAPVEKKFMLEDADKNYGGEGTYVIIRQATVRENRSRAEQNKEIIRETTAEGNERTILNYSYFNVQRLEVFLTLCECNLLDTDGQSLFKFKDNRIRDWSEFIAAWDKLPTDIASEIHDKVLQVNVDWSPFPVRTFDEAPLGVEVEEAEVTAKSGELPSSKD
jgi:hypothetical protein